LAARLVSSDQDAQKLTMAALVYATVNARGSWIGLWWALTASSLLLLWREAGAGGFIGLRDLPIVAGAACALVESAERESGLYRRRGSYWTPQGTHSPKERPA